MAVLQEGTALEEAKDVPMPNPLPLAIEAPEALATTLECAQACTLKASRCSSSAVVTAAAFDEFVC